MFWLVFIDQLASSQFTARHHGLISSSTGPLPLSVYPRLADRRLWVPQRLGILGSDQYTSALSSLAAASIVCIFRRLAAKRYRQQCCLYTQPPGSLRPYLGWYKLWTGHSIASGSLPLTPSNIIALSVHGLAAHKRMWACWQSLELGVRARVIGPHFAEVMCSGARVLLALHH